MSLLRRVARVNGVRRARDLETVHRGRWSGKRFRKRATYGSVLGAQFAANVRATHGKTRSAKRSAKARAAWSAQQEQA